MDFLTVLFFVLSLISSLLTGRFAGAALLRGAEEGARLALTLAGPLCLWSGFAALLEVNGWSRLLARGLRPLLRRLFHVPWTTRSAPGRSAATSARICSDSASGPCSG